MVRTISRCMVVKTNDWYKVFLPCNWMETFIRPDFNEVYFTVVDYLEECSDIQTYKNCPYNNITVMQCLHVCMVITCLLTANGNRC